MEAIVLAGGLGTRLRAVVSDVPKPMAPVRGRPFLELLLEYWIGQGVHRFVISVGYLAERITAHFGARWGGAEIDLLVVRGRRRLGFEFKRTVAPRLSRSMRTALEELGLESLRVIHAGENSFPLSERIRAVAISELGSEVRALE